MGIIATIVVGLLAGWLASMAMKSGGGLVMDLILGVVGGFVGGFLSNLIFGVNFMTGINITSIITGFVGSVIVIAIGRALRR